LIAVSFFDRGLNAAASLLCIYDSAYAKYSLGIYTMLKEIDQRDRAPTVGGG